MSNSSKEPDGARATGEHLTYRASGVDIDAQDEAIRRLTPHVRATFRPEVLSDVGLFGAAFDASFKGIKSPVLVSSTDGVGTKLKYAYRFGHHEMAGFDLAAVSINDIICSGAKPLFFLDYIATHKVEPEVIEELVRGMSECCKQAGAALIGGEIAEMRDTYREGEYDLAGFSVGVVSREKMLPRGDIMPGDGIIGIPSSGLHANGFTMVRKVFESLSDEEWERDDPELGASLLEEVTTKTRVYACAAGLLLSDGNVKALVHVSGGGMTDNIPRVLPERLGARIEKDSLETQPIFGRIRELGAVEEREMFRTFNMGIGLALIVAGDETARHLDLLSHVEPRARLIGSVFEGSVVEYV